MKKIRRFLSAMLISIVGISSFSMPVYADVATPSEIVSIPEFSPEINLPVASASELPLFSNSSSSTTLGSLAGGVNNTVSYSGVKARFEYADSSGARRIEKVPLDSDGTFVIPQLVDIDRTQKMTLGFEIGSGSLPSYGTYQMEFLFSSDVGVTYNSSTITIQFYKYNTNASGENSYSTISCDTAAGSLYFSEVVEIANPSYFDCWIPVGTVPPIGGAVYVNFKKTSSDPGLSSPGSSDMSGDIQQNINNTVGDISSGVSAIDDSIKELIQTISNQLTALWNQFASEFTNFYTAWQNHTNSIVQAIQAISTAATDGIENIISSADKNAQDIQDNADKNTDQIVNGYDNSGMTSENERLDGAISGYEDVESGIKDDVTGYIHDFDMPSWDNIFSVPGVLSAAGFIGGFMQDCFDGMGIWNIQITLSLTFIFVLMLIGYHRFRR